MRSFAGAKMIAARTAHEAKIHSRSVRVVIQGNVDDQCAVALAVLRTMIYVQ